MRIPRNLCWPSGELVTRDQLVVLRALRGETVTDVELAIRLDDGKLLPISISMAPVRRGGDVVGAVGVVRDLSLHKELDRRRDEWSSVIAHDLRQPVNGIRLAAELIERAALPERYRAMAGRIRDDAMRLNVMIEDLLDSSRIEAKRLALTPVPTRIDEVIDVVLERLPGIAARVVRDIGPDAEVVVVDPGRFVQVLGNLLSNAERYSTPGTAVRISAAREGERVTIRVSNEGAGIAPDEILTVFDRFARTRSGRARAEGIGLGLYLAKGLVEAHGGRMWVESQPGATTTFSFTLHAAETDDDAARSASPMQDHPT